MKRNLEDVTFWIVAAVIALPVCGAIAYLYFSGMMVSLSHPSEHPGRYNATVATLVKLAFFAILAVVALLIPYRRRRNSNDEIDPTS